MWATGIDVTDQFARNRETASDKQTDAALLHGLYAIFANKPFLAGDALRIYDEIEAEKRRGSRGILTFPTEEDADKFAVHGALKEMCGDKPVTSARIGNWARRVENAYIAGLLLTCTTNSRQQTDLCITLT
jgi:hypothetical protein